MFRKVMIIGGLVAAALGLSACTIDPSTVAKNVQNICKIEVSVADIANVISNDPAVTNAEAIAAMICQAFGQASTPSSSAAEKAKTAPAKGAVVHFNVTTENGKTVPITATVL